MGYPDPSMQNIPPDQYGYDMQQQYMDPQYGGEGGQYPEQYAETYPQDQYGYDMQQQYMDPQYGQYPDGSYTPIDQYGYDHQQYLDHYAMGQYPDGAGQYPEGSMGQYQPGMGMSQFPNGMGMGQYSNGFGEYPNGAGLVNGSGNGGARMPNYQMSFPSAPGQSYPLRFRPDKMPSTPTYDREDQPRYPQQEMVEPAAEVPSMSNCIGCSRPAVVHCPSCNADYCKECDTNTKVSGPAHVNLHNSVSLEKKRGQRFDCKQHDKTLSLFCNECATPICSQCVIFGRHKDHDCVPVDQAYGTCMDIVDTKVKSLNKSFSLHRAILDQLQARRQQLGKSVENALLSIRRDFSTLHKKLDQKEESLNDYIQDIQAKRLEALRMKLEQVNNDIDEMVVLHKSVQVICDDSSPAQFLKSFKAMEKDLERSLQNGQARDKEVGVQAALHLQVFVDDLRQTVDRLAAESSIHGVDLQYQHDTDEYGLFYRLGTLDGPNFLSPVMSGCVHVTASQWHLESDKFVAESAWQENSGFLITSNKIGSWVQFQLLRGFTISPVHYRIQNGNQVKPGSKINYILRHWRFEGSKDGTSWDILKEHVNDAALSVEPYATASWKLDETTTRYSSFRIVSTGPDSGGQHFVHFGSIEIWGRLHTPTSS
eukprot:c46071_g1_i1.p1 GENE.c46071_g1_i1~~c46071_g1_i1.p1  ORF type:complete len:716 (-),score=109.20 c46071_g1_i1:34-1983(-)